MQPSCRSVIMHKQPPGVAILQACALPAACADPTAHGSRNCSQVIRRIDVPLRDIRWADSGELVALIGEASFYVLRFDRGAVDACAGGRRRRLDEDGIEDAFSWRRDVRARAHRCAPAAVPLTSCTLCHIGRLNEASTQCAWVRTVCAVCALM